MLSTPIDVEAARRVTPGCAERIHLDNAGASLPTSTVLEVQIDHLKLEAQIGGYEAHAHRQARIDQIRPSIARLVNAADDEIALTVNNTAGFDLFVYSLPFEPGDRILTTESEYGANYVAYLQIAARTGARVDVVPSTGSGEIDVGALEAMIDDRVRLIALNHVPTNSGLVNPVAEVGRIARANQVLFLLDACQSAGQLPLDVEAIGCDALTSTGRKYLRGPRGTGFLYVRRSVLKTIEPVMIDHEAATWVSADSYVLKDDATRFENWERNYVALLGLGQAVDEAIGHGLDAIEARVTHLADGLRSRLHELPGAEVRDIGTKQCGIVTFSIEHHDPSAVKSQLRDQSINMSVVEQSSALLDSLARNLPPLLRASVHYYNTDDELDQAIEALRSL